MAFLWSTVLRALQWSISHPFKPTAVPVFVIPVTDKRFGFSSEAADQGSCQWTGLTIFGAIGAAGSRLRSPIDMASGQTPIPSADLSDC
jgi:hypothetical protein